MIDESTIQGSASWLALRKSKITSTDSGIILGISPYCSPYTLWQRKLSLIPEQETNAAMRMGSELEPIARSAFIAETGIDIEPAVLFHKTHHFMMSSLDGLSKCLKIAAELKCSKKIYEKALNNEIDPIYYSQCQHHIAVADIDMIYFYAYWDGKSKLIEVKRDDAFIDNMIDKEKEFYDSLQSFTPPISDKDYLKVEDAYTISLADEAMEAQKQYTYWKKKYETSKDKLVNSTSCQSCIVGEYKLTKYYSKGRVDYSAIPELKDVDTNIYRKAPIEAWKLSEV